MSSKTGEDNEEETLDDDNYDEVLGPEEERLYKEKLIQMKNYLPTLQVLKEKCLKDGSDSSGIVIKKLDLMYSMFCCAPKKKLNLASLLRCEDSLKNIAEKLMKVPRFADTSPSGRETPPSKSQKEPKASTSRVLSQDKMESPPKNLKKTRIPIVYEDTDKPKFVVKKNVKRLTSEPCFIKNEDGSISKRIPVPFNDNKDQSIKKKPSPIRFSQKTEVNKKPSPIKFRSEPVIKTKSSPKTQDVKKKHSPITFTPEPQIKKKHSPIRFTPEPEIKKKHSPIRFTPDSEVKKKHSPIRFTPEPEIRMKKKHSSIVYGPDREESIQRNHLPFRPSWIHEGFRPVRPNQRIVWFPPEQRQRFPSRHPHSQWNSNRPRHPNASEVRKAEDSRIVVHAKYMDNSIIRTTSVYCATSLKRSTTVEPTSQKLKTRPSFSSPNLNLNDLKHSEMQEKDQDALNLQKSEHNIKVLMKNRFANLRQLSKFNSTVKDHEHSTVNPLAEEAPAEISPFSSTLDEMMSNLNSRNRTARCQLQLTQNPPEEIDTKVVKTLINESDKADISQTVNKLLLESKTSTVASPETTKEDDNKQTAIVASDCTEPKLDKEDEQNTSKGICLLQTKETCQLTKEQIKDETQGNYTSQDLEARVTDLLEYFRSKTDTISPEISEPVKEPVKIHRSSILELPFPLGSTELDQSIREKRHEEISLVQDKTSEAAVIEKRPISLKSTEEPDVIRPNQSLRAKLSEEISTLHKVGLPYGGALRGFNRDRMMPPGRIASLKPGTLIDLIQEEKPQRPMLKHKNKPHTQISSSNSMTNVPEPIRTISTSNDANPLSTNQQQRDTNEILSKMSENDLKQLIHKNIGDLPIPPILSCFNTQTVYSQELSNQTQVSQHLTWNTNNNAMKQVSIHAQNVIVNNINVMPTEFNNTINSSVTHQQSSLANEGWLPNHNSDVWMNKVSSNDPRRGSQNMSASTIYTDRHDPNSGIITFGQIEYNHQPLDIPAYSSTDKNSKTELMKDTVKSTSYNPPLLQSDPFMSPCYDGSSTPDPYRPDPYTLSLQENLEKQECSYNSVAIHPEAVSRPPLLRTPPLMHYNRDGIPQRSTLLSTPSAQHDRDDFQMYSDNQPVRSVDQRNDRYYVDTSYSAWKESRRYSHSQVNQRDCTTPYYDRVPDNRRNFKWSRESQNSNQFDHRSREYANRHYTDNAGTVRPTHKEPDFKKLAPRDPRRRSVDESSGREGSVKCSSTDSKIPTIEQRSYKRESRQRNRSPSRDRGKSREKRYSGDRSRSSSKGRSRNTSSLRYFEKSENSDKKPRDKSYKDTYTSPLDDLYSNTATPKTGLGYGFQKFRIPKLNRSTSESSKVKNAHESKSEKLDSQNSNHNKKFSEDLDMVSSKEKPNQSDIDTPNSESLHPSVSQCNEVKSENLKSESNKSIVDQDDHSRDGESPKIITAEEKAEEVQSSNEEKVKSPLSTKVNDSLVTQNENQVEPDSIKSQKEGDTSSCRRSKRLSKIRKVNQGSENCENSTDVNTGNVSITYENTKKKTTETKPKTCDDVHPNIEKAEAQTNLTDSLTLNQNKIKIEDNLKDNENDTETDTKTNEPSEPSLQPSRIHDTEDVTSVSEQILVGKSECLLTNNAEDVKNVSETNIIPSHKDDDGLEGSQKNLDSDQPISRGTQESSSLESECAMDLSVKKNTDEEISSSSDRKSINNPPIVTGNHTKQFTSGLQVEKSSALNPVEVSTLKSSKSDIDVKSLTQLTPELLQNVFGITLTADKIKKVAELLSEDNCEHVSSTDQNFSEECTGDEDQVIERTCKSEVQTSQQETDNSVVLKKQDIEKKKQTNCRPAKGKGAKKKKQQKSKSEELESKSEDVERCSTRSAGQKQKRKYKNELDRLQDDISKYHDSEAIAAASGPRLCRLQKEKMEQSLNNSLSQQVIKKKLPAKKITRVKEESPDNSDVESDSSDSNSLYLLSEKLKSKYEPLILENTERLRREQKLKEEANKQKLTAISSQEICLKSASQNDILDSSTMVENKLDESEITLNKKIKQNKCSPSNTYPAKGEPCLQEPLEKKNSTNIPIKQTVHQTKVPDTLNKIKIEANEEVLSSESCTEKNSKEKMKTQEKFEEKSDSDEEGRHKMLSNNILHKYGIKKQRKKCFWKVGVIKKKSKPKKPEKLENSPDIDDHLEEDNSYEADNSYDLIVPDENYFQEGESKVTKCKLCPFSGKAIVSHYAITHPKDEVLISRMSRQAAEAAIKESKIFFRLDDIKKQEMSIFECRICCQRFSKFSVFFEHMALHTGEFRHECCKCGYRTSTRSGIVKHYLTHNVKTSTKPSCRVLYKEPLNRTFFCGYLCSFCNFFQISQRNVKRHIENTHDNQDVSNIIQINFSKLWYEDSDFCDNEVIKHSEKDTSLTPSKLPLSDVDTGIQEKMTLNLNRDEISPIKIGETAQTIQDEERNSDSSNDLLTRESQGKDFQEESDGSKTSPLDCNTETVVKPLEEGCFELSLALENHAQFIEAEVSNSYKQKCIEAVAAISVRKSPNHLKELIKTLESKEESEPNNVYTLQNLIGKKRKEKTVLNVVTLTGKQFSDQVTEKNEEILPTRRQLPERSCKGLLKLKSNESENDISVDECYTDLFETLDEPEIEDSDPVLHDNTFKNLKSEKAPMLFEGQLVRCTEHAAVKQLYEPKVQTYESSLPINSNLSEFTHVMHKISDSSLKLPDCKQICVGGLKVAREESEVVFSCSLKLFNKQCEFQSSELLLFGQHINVSHHHSFWDGTCGSCFVVFTPDPTSHDKATLFTQSKAFCHLVKEHLSFLKNSNSEEKESSLKKVSEVRPMLRVRRLSGDMLSVPGPHSENSLAVLQKEGLGVDSTSMKSPLLSKSDAFSGSSKVDSFAASTSSQSSERSESNCSSPTTALWLNKSEGTRQLEGQQTTIATKAASFKVVPNYTTMCEHKKLRHFYKCMGARCAFTTSGIRDFITHMESHRDVIKICPEQDPHNGYWQLCSYCFNRYTTTKDLGVHLRKEHGECTLQCGKCFYRAKSLANVHFHHMVEHPETDFVVLQCEQREQNLPAHVDKPFTDFVLALRCSKAGCNLFTYMLSTFCQHLINVHKTDPCCHMCYAPFTSFVEVLEHYRQTHGIGLYQCLYCIFGTGSEYEIRHHLCNKHPNTTPKAIQRTEGGSKSNPGTHNRESLRRIVFYKDEEKLLKYVIPVPQCEIVHNVSSLQPPHERNTSLSFSHPKAPTKPNILRRGNPDSVKRPHLEDSPIRRKIFLSSQPSSSSTKGAKLVPVPVTSVNPSEKSCNTSSKNVLALTPAAAREVTSSAKLTQISADTPAYSPINIHATEQSGISVATSSASSPIPTTASIVVSIPSVVTSTSSVVTSITAPSPSHTVTSHCSSLENTSDTYDSTEEFPIQEAFDENYFKCGNKGCCFEAGTATALKNHLVVCDQARQSQRLECAYCQRLFKQATSLLDHLRTHGPPRFSCSLCVFKAPLQSRVNSHMKSVHHVSSTILVPVDSLKQDPDRDWFLVSPKVDKVLATQAGLMKESSSSFNESVSPILLSRKRRRSSSDVVVEGQGQKLAAVVLEDPAPTTPTTSDSSLNSELDTTNTSPQDIDDTPITGIQDLSPGENTETPIKRKKKRRDKCPSRHRFSCHYCKVTTKFRHSILIHTKKNHPNLQPQIINLTRSPHKTDAFNCMYCNCTATDTINLKHHWTLTHRASGLNFMFRETVIHNELEYECFYCKERSLIENLEKHCKQAHPEERFLVVSVTVPKYKCSECKLVFNSVDILKRHFSMDHPSKHFCYIVLNTQRPTDSTENDCTTSDNPVETPKQRKKHSKFKCFNCHFVSTTYWTMIRHMQRHFFTYVCRECDSLYLSAFGIRSHMFNKHPESQAKPLLIKGSTKDIENAKKNIIIVSESGRKRRITEEELAIAEREENMDEENLDFDESLEDKGDSVVVKETARKSTGSPRKYPVETLAKPPDPQEQPRLPSKSKRPLYKVRRKKLNLKNLYVTVSSNGKNIRLPVSTLTKIVNFDVQLSLYDEQT